jgi:hypothetical protein
VDDASALAPGRTVADALVAHRSRRDTGRELVGGALLLEASTAWQLRAAALADDSLAVGLVGDTGLAGLEAARDALQDDPWVRLDHVQPILPATDRPAAAVTRLLADLSFTVPAFVVVRPGAGLADVLTAVADDGAERVGLRCGPDDVPEPDALADFLLGCASRRLPFRLTDGLVHAVRREDRPGATQHGFLNAVAATWAALDGGDHEAVAALLASQDPELLLTVLEPADVPRLRAVFLAFGSRDVDTTHRDLVDLGLADPDPDPR